MSERRQGPGPAFQLAQLGAHAAARFAERLEPLRLTPPEAGILWNLSQQPNLTQRALAELLGTFPSRLVLLLDQLEDKGLVQRHPDPSDRRSYSLRLTAAGMALLDALGRVSREHQDDLCAALSNVEREQLRTLLAKMVEQQGLKQRVHPGFGKK
jgi:DNA-binding MarR family transcriptional regulator